MSPGRYLTIPLQEVQMRLMVVLFTALILWTLVPGRLWTPSTPGDQANADVLDILIKDGRVVDGSGSSETLADVGIRGDRIVFVGKAGGRSAARTINASGLVVAPGFIDPHTHTAEDLSDPARRSNLAYLMQGVTTVATGNDGSSPWPSRSARKMGASGY